MKDYLFYVRFALSGLTVYHCKTDDPFHTMGEIHYRTIEQITRMTYTEQTQTRLDFWKEQNQSIYEWYNKYNKKES